MKALFVLTILLLPLFLSAQGPALQYKWEVRTSFAYEKHDKRFYDYFQQKIMLMQQPEEWGTSWYRLTLNRSIFQNDRFSFKVGLGLAKEKQTFRRPYHPTFMPKKGYILTSDMKYTSKYNLYHFQIPINYELRIFQGLHFAGKIESNFSMFKFPNGGPNLFTTPKDLLSSLHYHEDLDFYSIAVYPEIKYYFNRIGIGINYRAYQYKKIDRVTYDILFRDPNDPRLNIKYEEFNPKQIGFTLSYRFGKIEPVKQK